MAKHNGESAGPDGMLSSVRREPGLEHFSRPIKGNKMSLPAVWYWGPSFIKLDFLDRDKIASKHVFFLVSSSKEREECGDIDSSLFINMSASQMSEYLGKGGLSLKHPLVTLLIIGFDPNVLP